MNHKNVYVDFYHSLFENDGVSIDELVHLNSMDIITETDIGNVVEQLKQLIFKPYGDGLYIQAEEFKDLCYLNVIIMFGEDYSSLAEYLDSINSTAKVEVNKDDHSNFLSVDYFFSQEETKDLRELLEKSGIESEVYFIERKAFDRGAGDYHENVILSFLKGSAAAMGSRITNHLMGKFGEYNPRLTSFNTEHILSHISKETGINKQDLRVTKIEDIPDNKIEIQITNRYKKIKVVYDKPTRLINYEVLAKTRTMI